MPEFRSDDSVLYFDIEENHIGIQVVESRLGPNAIIVLEDEEMKKLISYIKGKSK